MSLESADEAGFFVATTDTYGVLASVGPGSDGPTRQPATFEVVPGLADPTVSRSASRTAGTCATPVLADPGFANDGTDLFRGDATFCARRG